VQNIDKRNLGEILITLGHVTHDVLAQALSEGPNTEYVTFSDLEVDPEVIGIIGVDALVEHEAVPLRIEDGRLMVAMSDPRDIHARGNLASSAGYPITPVVAAGDTIRRTQELLFGLDTSTRSVADAMAGRKAQRTEPGGQPEVDLGEPVFEPRVASEAGDGFARSMELASAPVPGAERSNEGRQADGGERHGRGGARGGRIGDILVSEGKITGEQLEQALAVRRNDPRDLGKILLSLGFVIPADLAQALAKRLRLDYVVISDLSEDDVDPVAQDLIGEETVRKYNALPLRIESGRLVVAMSDPNDIYALEDLRVITKHPITPVVATEEDLEGAFAHLFGTEEDVYPEVSGEPAEVPNEGPAEADISGFGLSAAQAEYRAEPLPDESETTGGESEGANGRGNARPGQSGPSGDALSDEDLGGDLEDSGSGASEALPARVEESRSKRVAIGSGRIGDILVSKGKVTEQQLEQALAMQKYDPREVGKILLSLGYVNNLDLAQALARRLRLGFVDVSERDVDPGVGSLIEQKVLRKYGVVPLRLENGRIVVAMSDPTNIHALEDLTMLSGYPVTPVVAVEEEIRRVLNKLFAMSEGVSEFLEEAGREPVKEHHGELELGVGASPDEAPIIRLVSSILQQAVGDGASDIHIEPQARELAVRMRVDGVLRESMSIPTKLQSGVIARLKIVANLDIAERRVPQDGRFSVKLGGHKVDLRVASLPTVYGEKVVLRLLDTSNAAVDLTELGFPPKVYEQYEEIFRRPYGTILVTGPTGSGKSTTLYATLNELNSPEKNIITVEDPVEFRMQGINQIQTNPRAGLTFASALRSILRADPDIMMIGEIRDFETAKIAVEAALTGHLVLATLHTNDAPGALGRLTDMGVEPFLTSSAVDCVIAQRLARRLCETCKEPVELEKEILTKIRFPFEHAPEGDLHFHKAVGCGRCGGSGYRGRMGIYELMSVTEKIKEMILRRASTGEIQRATEEEGMVRLRSDGLLKAANGATTVEEVLRTVV
jgi:type IV pilus assembly protein PilB